MTEILYFDPTKCDEPKKVDYAYSPIPRVVETCEGFESSVGGNQGGNQKAKPLTKNISHLFTENNTERYDTRLIPFNYPEHTYALYNGRVYTNVGGGGGIQDILPFNEDTMLALTGDVYAKDIVPLNGSLDKLMNGELSKGFYSEDGETVYFYEPMKNIVYILPSVDTLIKEKSIVPLQDEEEVYLPLTKEELDQYNPINPETGKRTAPMVSNVSEMTHRGVYFLTGAPFPIQYLGPDSWGQYGGTDEFEPELQGDV